MLFEYSHLLILTDFSDDIHDLSASDYFATSHFLQLLCRILGFGSGYITTRNCRTEEQKNIEKGEIL